MQIRRLAALAFASSTLAQTYTDCNPTNETCPSDTGLNLSTYSVDFTQGASDDWNMTYGSVSYDSSGAAFTITESGDAPTMQSNWYIFFGVITVLMRAAPGTGIVSCAILESDDLDEIDWEWLGGSVDEVETNYFGKGNTTSYDRATYVDVTDSQDTTHNYTIEWTSAATTWYIDGTAVRTLAYADALEGENYPQTPMRVKLGLWAGGDSTQNAGTIEWAGGETDYDDGPFTMYVEKIEITNYNPGSTYTYGDKTGAYSSIEVDSSDATNSTSSTYASSNNGTDISSSSNSTSSGNSSTSSSSSSTTGTSGASITVAGSIMLRVVVALASSRVS
ncbi:concanavalin A-like lectin/glucanase domain-containing protein [Pseudomassariella vexata]|uniref:chitinase n=1 Tax=Pseudomassariella vexata TaxID=1141098 RepID=A0A1Y2EFS9_9PEZI|nr:concanavalin A-like lectin/glucanase domain-containing protein [Pseudomassariella vexata]ORY70432.1 concanavalin A-like lectin/glucanase domain-containing protein [Pseudomassariella vexata]